MKVQFFFRFLLEGPFKVWLEVNKSGSNPRQLREEVLKMIIHIVYINNENRIIVSKHVSKRTTVIFVHIIQFPNSRIHKYLHWKFGKKVQQQFTLRHDIWKWRTRTVKLSDLPDFRADDTYPRPPSQIIEWKLQGAYVPSLSENESKQNRGRFAERLQPSSNPGRLGSSSSGLILSKPSGVFSRISVRQEMYTAASLMVSVLEGFFSPGKSGIRSLNLSMCALRVCTRLLSRALAIRLCRLTPVKRGPRLLVFLFPWVLSGLAAIVVSMADCCAWLNCL